MSAIRKNDMSVLVTGIVRNVALTIERDMTVIEQALQDFRSIKWFLVESDSSDFTIEKLKDISSINENFSFVTLGKIQKAGQSRTVAMAKARNRYLEEIRENPDYLSIDILAISDFNGLNKKLTRDAVASCFEVNNWDACFANQSGRYYDIWALRHPLWSPNDCWQQLSFYRKYYRFPEFALAASVRSRMIRIPQDSEWIEVDSAFGGFAFYRMDALGKAEYEGQTLEGNAICEHVPFHAQMRKNQKRLYINPKLINARSTDHSIRMNLSSTMFRIAKYPFKVIGLWVVKSRSRK